MDILNLIQQLQFQIRSYETVGRGDINQAYCLHTNEKKLFLKMNQAKAFPKIFEQEAAGLNELRQNCTILLPQILEVGTYENFQYILLEWMEKGVPSKQFWLVFGQQLAALHQRKQPYFGFPTNNYIGSLTQVNTPMETWQAFYSNCRIIPLIQKLISMKFAAPDLEMKALRFCGKIDEIFPNEPPALLHGDLWAGNYMVHSSGCACVYDPAVYFGHREMDLGMTKLFGGFSSEFYTAYNDFYPLEKNWQQRLPYTQLYPLLVHAILFGGHYVNSVKQILSPF